MNKISSGIAGYGDTKRRHLLRNAMTWTGLFSPLSAGALVLLLFMLAVPAYARLGGKEADLSMELVSMDLDTRAHVMAASHYRVHTFGATTQGIQIRQYADPDGNIFGVTWDGPVKPDLSRLLGSYYGRYLDAASSVKRLHGLRQVNQADFALRLGGHMRHFHGIAWVPGLLPVGVMSSELK